MSNAWTLREALRARLAAERGAPFYSPGSQRVAMVYPSPYRVGMSSLGFQWISGQLADAGFSVERVFLPDDAEAWRHSKLRPISMETHTALGQFPLLAVSVAYELELAGLIEILELAGIPPLRADRTPGHPKILIGGPLTFSNPLPLGPFADAVLLGEADDTVVPAVEGFFATGRFDHVADLPGGWLPEAMGERLPAVGRAEDERLPARSRLWAPDAELHDMFLMEGERGCHRACTFCVMRRSTNGGMRLVTPEKLLSYVPPDAPRVGLVGAAISDHPQLVGLLESLVEAGKGIGISSLRADRVALKPDIPRLLRLGGYKTLTVASDAASQRLRRTIMKGTTEAHLVACAEAAREHKYRTLKVYMMLGVPDETDEDIDELITFTRKLAAIHPTALGIAPFVPKRNTPLDGASFAGISLVEGRLSRLTAGLRGSRAEVRPTSARWAWVEHKLASAGIAGGHIAIAAVHGGGTFAAWKKAFKVAEEAAERPWRGWEGATV
ncbi:MAG: radical SAM protein [Pseudomonadota bacterium]|nr:radical SAM protein [Pseudomonadota bacterium]